MRYILQTFSGENSVTEEFKDLPMLREHINKTFFIEGPEVRMNNEITLVIAYLSYRKTLTKYYQCIGDTLKMEIKKRLRMGVPEPTVCIQIREHTVQLLSAEGYAIPDFTNREQFLTDLIGRAFKDAERELKR